MRKLAVFIVISLIIHLSSYTGVSAWASSLLKNRPRQNLTQIEIVETPPAPKSRSHERPIIKQLDPKEVINSNETARFESEKTQRVKHETKASLNGLTTNSVAKEQRAQNENNKNSNQSEKKSQERKYDEPGELPEFTRVVSSRSSHAQAAQISMELPSDIQAAGATNLNTDATTYYSFYSRVEELFYVRWVERLNFYWDRLPFEFKRDHLAGHGWRTQITVLLDANGVYQSSVIEMASGYKPFDDAVVYAFQNAHFFPNVPKTKVEPDGYVRLRYGFIVNIGSYR